MSTFLNVASAMAGFAVAKSLADNRERKENSCSTSNEIGPDASDKDTDLFNVNNTVAEIVLVPYSIHVLSSNTLLMVNRAAAFLVHEIGKKFTSLSLNAATEE